ncbi:hypothetical protein ACT91Q_01490 [Brevibacillus thermoruber]|uniref:hypothetical protein n=1 Tax=Brevibacillus thermoruber TaxID=33942 RepID=UPI0040419A7F
MSIYTREELEKLLQVNGQEKVYLPNSIFTELKRAMVGHEKNKSSKHIPFAYAYVFIISYLWRYAKFGSSTNDYDYTEKELKRLLGVNEVSKGFDYITKKGGILEQLDYIRKESDYPVSVKLDDNNLLEFTMYSEIIDYIPHELKQSRRNRKVNFPVRGYYFCPESEEDDYEDGYFFEIENTHEVSIETFLHCMSKEDIGLEGFYVFQYLSYQSNNGKRFWNCPQNYFESEFGINAKMVREKIKALEAYNMIENTHELMILGLPADVKAFANGYSVIESTYWRETKKEVPKRKVMNYKRALREFGDTVFLYS